MIIYESPKKQRRSDVPGTLNTCLKTRTPSLSGGTLMNILPTLETVTELARTGQYTVLPVSCEILSDFTTPIEVLRVL